jgi:hypothetical protein
MSRLPGHTDATARDPALRRRLAAVRGFATGGHRAGSWARRARPERGARCVRGAYDPRLELQPGGGGSLVPRDPLATVNVAPDGMVDMQSTPYFSVTLNLPTPSLIRRQLDQRDLAAWVADPYRDMRVGGPGTSAFLIRFENSLLPKFGSPRSLVPRLAGLCA